MKIVVLVSLFFLFLETTQAQQIEKIGFSYGGAIVMGYVDNGAYINFTGPGIKTKKGNSEVLISVLPTLRFKNDKGATKNTFITPTLGFGITYTYKAFVVQLPFYYNGKTSTSNGKWNAGVGIGINLKTLKK
ncbi:hypothetical protein [Tenacibaculum sp. nBUS_03]|uniref:hypothetical protein n=1 Tax=Tenacibaculum sp. nBUS_03 TaxID=3395320 RepID=UPI003EBB8EF5